MLVQGTGKVPCPQAPGPNGSRDESPGFISMQPIGSLIAITVIARNFAYRAKSNALPTMSEF
jgi:hypothetical protein